MKKFSELKIGQEFSSQSTITLDELEAYLSFSGIKNIAYEGKVPRDGSGKMVSGRAILARIEGEFTRLDEMYGNSLIFYGVDGDPTWNGRQTRFLRPLHIGEKIRIKFTISDKRDLNDDFGLISIDFEGSDESGKTILISKRNLYQMKKEPPLR